MESGDGSMKRVKIYGKLIGGMAYAAHHSALGHDALGHNALVCAGFFLLLLCCLC